MIPMVDLLARYRSVQDDLEAAVLDVLRSGQWVQGTPVEAFERAFADFVGVRHCVAVSNGTAALHVALLAAGVGPGDEVITSSMTFVATVEAILLAGATPVLVDVDPQTLTLDPARVRAALGERTRVILPVHLYGRPAPMGELRGLADEVGALLIEDAAQAHGATLGGRRAGSLGDAGCFSFYPTKNLGAVGEGGAVTTDDDELATRLRQVRDHGAAAKNHHVRLGMNQRMSAIQGAALGVMLPRLEGWVAERRRVARRYDEGLAALAPPRPRGSEPPALEHAWHLYVVRHPRRDELARRLLERGVGTGVHYPKAVHQQPAFAGLGHPEGSLPEAERASAEVLSLPMYPELTDEQVDDVARAVVACWEEP